MSGRRLILALAACSLVACGSGVFIEVDTTQLPEPVDRIELITSKKHCHLPFAPDVRCDHMQGEDFPRAFGTENDIFTRHLTASVAVGADGLAVFELAPGFGVLPMVFAVARNSQGVPIGVEAMDGTIDSDAGSIVYHVTIQPADGLFAGRDRTRAAGVKEWGAARECIGVEPVVTTDRDRGKVFIVPEDNPDCDSRSDPMECDPLWFDGYNRDFESGAHCVVLSPHLAQDGFSAPCVLGHVPTCAEVEPDPSQVCLEQFQPFPLCVPGALCLGMNNPCITPRDEVCLEATLAGTGPSSLEPHILCKPPSVNLDPSLVPCANPAMIIERPAELGMAECKSVKLASGVGTFHASGESTSMLAQALFEIVDFDDCNVVLKWSGTAELARVLTDVLIYEVFVDGELRKLAFPIKFDPEVGCSVDTIPCQFNVNANPPSVAVDSIFHCAN